MGLELDLLYNGSWLRAADSLYTSATNSWWVIIILVATLVVLLIVTRSEAVVSLCGMFISAFLLVYKSDALPIFGHTTLYIIIVMSMAVFLYTIFGKET